jgi:hypothetical protein
MTATGPASFELLPLLFVVAVAVALTIRIRRGASRKTVKLLLITLWLLTSGIYMGLLDITMFSFSLHFLVIMILAYLISIALPISFAIIGVATTAAYGARSRLQAGTGFAAGVLGIVIGQIVIVIGEMVGLALFCLQVGECV